jgi:hypothetical protein
MRPTVRIHGVSHQGRADRRSVPLLAIRGQERFRVEASVPASDEPAHDCSARRGSRGRPHCSGRRFKNWGETGVEKAISSAQRCGVLCRAFPDHEGGRTGIALASARQTAPFGGLSSCSATARATCHGAGCNFGTPQRAQNLRLLSEEASEAYKDVA